MVLVSIFSFLALSGLALFLGATIWKVIFARKLNLEISLSQLKAMRRAKRADYPYAFIYILVGGGLLAFYATFGLMWAMYGWNSWVPAAILLYVTVRIIMALKKA
jgi:hypothetical protein